MTIFRMTMTALALACFTGATVTAGAQDVRRPGKTAAYSSHAKKRAPLAPQAKATAPRGLGDSERWMDRASASGNGGGGGY